MSVCVLYVSALVQKTYDLEWENFPSITMLKLVFGFGKNVFFSANRKFRITRWNIFFSFSFEFFTNISSADCRGEIRENSITADGY